MKLLNQLSGSRSKNRVEECRKVFVGACCHSFSSNMNQIQKSKRNLISQFKHEWEKLPREVRRERDTRKKFISFAYFFVCSSSCEVKSLMNYSYRKESRMWGLWGEISIQRNWKLYLFFLRCNHFRIHFFTVRTETISLLNLWVSLAAWTVWEIVRRMGFWRAWICLRELLRSSFRSSHANPKTTTKWESFRNF